MTRCILLIATTFATLLTGGLPANAQSQDQVYTAKGSPLRGKFTSIDRNEVKLSVGGAERTFAVNEISRLSFADEPGELRRARDMVLRSRYKEAVAELNKIELADIARDVTEQDVLFYRAFCLAKLAMTGEGDMTAAAQQLNNFVRDNGNNYHYYTAVETFGELAYAVGRYDTAVRYFSMLGEAPWPDVQLRAAVAQARSLVAQEKYPEAFEQYETVLKSDSDAPEAARQKLFASLGKAVCLANTNQAEEGVRLIEQLIDKEDPSDADLFGRAYNALGACYLAAEQPKDALLAYLHVDLLFSQDPDLHAESLYHLSRLWAELNKSDRAVQARSLLTTRYAGSAWAERP